MGPAGPGREQPCDRPVGPIRTWLGPSRAGYLVWPGAYLQPMPAGYWQQRLMDLAEEMERRLRERSARRGHEAELRQPRIRPVRRRRLRQRRRPACRGPGPQR